MSAASPTVVVVQDGRHVDYTPGTAKNAGDVVVQGENVGVVVNPIDAGRLGSLQMEGVEDWPKDTGSGTAITAGTLLYWNAGSSIVSTSSGDGKAIGCGIEKDDGVCASDDDETVRVLHRPN